MPRDIPKQPSLSIPAPAKPSKNYPANKWSIRKIVIDAGHGGSDPGAIGVNGIKEKDITLDIAKRLKGQIQEQGIAVSLTRNDDRFVSLWQRVNIVNKLAPDFFISIHANASERKKTGGFEVYYLSQTSDDASRAWADVIDKSHTSAADTTANSRELEAIVLDLVYSENRREAKELATLLCKATKGRLAIRSRGVKESRFYVLKNTKVPAILVEVGFVSNSKEGYKLANPHYRQQLVKALSSGILSYIEEFNRTDGFTK